MGLYNNLLHKFEENIQKIDNNSKLREACEIYLQDFKERGNNPNFKKDALLKGLTASVYLSENNNKLTEKEVAAFQEIVENYMVKAAPSKTAILNKTQEAKIAKDTEKREHVNQRTHAPKIGKQEKIQLLEDIRKIPNDKVKNKMTSLISALKFAYKESKKSEKPEEFKKSKELYNVIMKQIVGVVDVVTKSNEPDYKECSKIFKALHEDIKDIIPKNDKNWNIIASLIETIGTLLSSLGKNANKIGMKESVHDKLSKGLENIGSSIVKSSYAMKENHTSPDWRKVKEQSSSLQKELRKPSGERNKDNKGPSRS